MSDDIRKPVKFVIAFGLPGWKYDSEVRATNQARIASGYTSLRITKQTLADLQELRKTILELQRKERNFYGYGSLSMDDLLTRIATGNVGLSSSFVPPVAKPAKKPRRKVRP